MMGAFGAIISKVILGLAQWGLEKIQRWVLEQRAAAMESRIKSLEARQKSYEDKEEIEEKIDAAKSKVRKEQALRDDIVKKRDALCEWANKKSL